MHTGDVINIVTLNPDDWRAWRTVRLRALQDAPTAFGSSYVHAAERFDDEDYWRGYFVTDGQNYLADVGQGAIGLVRVTGGQGDDAELMSLWVAPEARGIGVAAALVETCWVWLQDTAPGQPLQLTVRRNNRPARRLYERLGFTFARPDADDPNEDVLIKHL